MDEALAADSLKKIKDSVPSPNDDEPETLSTNAADSMHPEKRQKRDESSTKKENRHLENVRKFMEEQKATLQDIFKRYTRKHENDPIECTASDKGNYKISPEDRRKYNLPRGIQGTQARHNRQNFNILLHNVVLSGVKLGLSGEYVNFADPRDAAEVLKQVLDAYDLFLKRNAETID